MARIAGVDLPPAKRVDIGLTRIFGVGRQRSGAILERAGIDTTAAAQIIDYLCAAHAALGALPDRDTVVFERFFDESGGMQLVIHSRFGSRLNRAWGLALRKRFCRKFNFELQAAATEDAIVLSLSESHSFALEEVARYLAPETWEATHVGAGNH